MIVLKEKLSLIHKKKDLGILFTEKKPRDVSIIVHKNLATDDFSGETALIIVFFIPFRKSA